MFVRSLAVIALVAASGCSGSSPDASESAPTTALAPELGSARGAALVELLGPAAGLKRPRDLAFNPLRPDELWIVNEDDDSMVIVRDASTEARSPERRRDSAASHFMHRPTSIAFGADVTSFGAVGTFATCQESRNQNGIEGAKDFMGPTLWSSDLSIFAVKDPEGLGSHLDMLHNSPLCMGLAHETANVYWTTNGRDGSIVRYDFAVDHDIGMDDHSDGASLEYVRGQLAYATGVPGHLAFHAASAALFVADPGNGRVARLDTRSGTRGQKLRTLEPQTGGHYRMDGAVLEDVVPPGVLAAPSGLELRNELLYVSDHASGRIVAFDLAGKEVASFDTGLGAGALAGIAFGPDGRLYLVDMIGSRVFRVEPR